MKKVLTLFAALAMTATSFAQGTVTTGHKALDNTYVGVNAGVNTPFHGMYVLDNAAFKNFTPTVGVRVGKNFTTVFGLAAEGNIYFESEPKYLNTKTFIDALDVNLYGTANLMNLFAGYKGQPRCFEIIALGGFGWTHVFGVNEKVNGINSRVALDFAFNLGKQKAWQLYVEPSLNYNLAGWVGHTPEPTEFQYDSHRAQLGLKVGFNYKFNTSNGTHNFAIEKVYDQNEIDALNARINSLQAECAQKCDALNSKLSAANNTINQLQKALDECNNRPAPEVKETANLQPTVVFAQGKSVVAKNQMANISLIATYMQNHPDAKVKICGYASPEGSAKLNQKLSEKRAEAVKAVLVNKYKIAADRLETEGLGATDKLFDEVEFNRIATFNDQSK